MGRVALFFAGFLAAACTFVTRCCLYAGSFGDEFEEGHEDWS